MAVTVYSTGCPKCKVLETKLNKKDIEFKTCTDLDTMLNLGFTSAPILGINGTFFNFNLARKLVDAYDASTSFEQFALSNATE